LVPLILICTAPPFAIALWIIATVFEGNTLAALSASPSQWIEAIPWPSMTAVTMLASWIVLQLALLVLLPAATHDGPVTPAGNRPRYRINGVSAFIVTHVLAVLLVGLGFVPGAIVHDHFGELLVTSSLFALGLCVALYFKGLVAPSSSDSGLSGNPIWDVYWGTELHPAVGGIQLKQLFNCRVAMMGWSIIVLSFAAAQVDRHGSLTPGMAVSVALQLIYIFKFFVWESGYFDSIDITHDRFSFYICWGVMAWLPSVYTIGTLCQVQTPSTIGWAGASVLFLVGISAILVNYAADRQRQRVRASGGTTQVWGRAPSLIHARYRAADGVSRPSLLLTSGFWGIARHFHYLPEILGAVAWTAAVGFDHALPWFYVFFLSLLLVDRAGRDERRCAAKYGAYWEEYCRRVPWRIMPGLY
jgi:7-dehydrocholesterol reductase